MIKLILSFLFLTKSLGAFSSENLRQDQFTIGSLGDSITTGNNARGWGDGKQYNWSTGSSSSGGLESHFKKLEKHLTKEVSAVNVAVSGATSHGIDAQVTELLRHNPDYVTLLIGANDACALPKDHMGSVKIFEERIESSLSRLITNNPEVKILMVPIPDMYHLWEIGVDACGWKWDLFGACSSLLSSSRTETERLEFKSRLDDLNKSLSKVQSKYKENIKFSKDLANYQFSKEDISSKDCFHPSLKGQNKISELSWEKSWFSHL